MRLRRSTIDKQKERLKRQYSSTLRRIRKYVDPDLPQSKWDQFKDRLQTSFLKTDGIIDRLRKWLEKHQAKAETDVERKRLGELLIHKFNFG